MILKDEIRAEFVYRTN